MHQLFDLFAHCDTTTKSLLLGTTYIYTTSTTAGCNHSCIMWSSTFPQGAKTTTTKVCVVCLQCWLKGNKKGHNCSSKQTKLTLGGVQLFIFLLLLLLLQQLLLIFLKATVPHLNLEAIFFKPCWMVVDITFLFFF